MPQFKNAVQLSNFREKLKKSDQKKTKSEPIITIGMGTCGIAAGASETLQAIERELQKREIKATIRSVGCIGMCVNEPLVDIQLSGQPRVTYKNIRAAQVTRLIEEHIIKGHVVYEWAIGYIPSEW
jgi:NADP-reducing hydrogenase subunit HndB